ncbi:MAG: tRNA-dihydrouridine synthase [Candidatus Peregrinibacteria bacterium]
MVRGFWEKLPKPIIGLSPMDGVTDAAYRYMVAKTGKPDVIITEFVNVEGLARGAVSMLNHLLYDEIERPVVAQIYGVEVESFYKVALMVCELGFDGIDINMGCPANKVARRGSGAGLIRTPEVAKEIIRIVQKATQDWANGITLEEAGIRPKAIQAIRTQCHDSERRLLPVSVKTRIGYDAIVTEEWIKHLLEAEPANISLHGRTFKQMYLGEANWEEIGKAARLCKDIGTTLLGNGDIKSIENAHEKIKTYGLDGVLVGRATLGNPWFFRGIPPTPSQAAKGAIEHSEIYEQKLPERGFFNMRKHLGWYIKGFDGAKELRVRLMQSNSSTDVRQILDGLLSGAPAQQRF